MGDTVIQPQILRNEKPLPLAARSGTEDSPQGSATLELPQLNEESLPQGHVTFLIDRGI